MTAPLSQVDAKGSPNRAIAHSARQIFGPRTALVSRLALIFLVLAVFVEAGWRDGRAHEAAALHSIVLLTADDGAVHRFGHRDGPFGEERLPTPDDKLVRAVGL